MHQAAPNSIYKKNLKKKMLVQLQDYFDLLVSYFCDKTVNTFDGLIFSPSERGT